MYTIDKSPATNGKRLKGEDDKMTKQTEGKAASRRNFLKMATVTAPAAAAAVVASGTDAQAAAPRDEGGTGLRDTQHTRSYYDTARF